MASLTVIHDADLRASPWKNGGGVTREVAASPAGASMDEFAWRVSVADVVQSGPFSRFPGVDRTLVLLDGAGMILDEGKGARAHALGRPLDIARFPGESAIEARLVDGATRDFNLMVRRDAARGALEVWRAGEAHRVDADAVLLYCAQGPVRVCVNDRHPIRLQSSDTLLIDTAGDRTANSEPTHIATIGDGALLAVVLRITR